MSNRIGTYDTTGLGSMKGASEKSSTDLEGSAGSSVKDVTAWVCTRIIANN